MMQQPSPAAQSAQIPLGEVQRFLMEALPVAAIAHSFHVDALADPALQSDSQYQRFSLIELNELHHQIAALGALMRLQMGDPTALRSLGMNLVGFIQNRQAALQVAQGFSPAIMANHANQVMMSLLQQSNQQVTQNWPVLAQTLTAMQAPAPGPLMVGKPMAQSH
jgi:predicted RNase H-like nuclease